MKKSLQTENILEISNTVDAAALIEQKLSTLCPNGQAQAI